MTEPNTTGEKHYKPVESKDPDDIRLDWSQSVLQERHGQPAPEHIQGPFWSEYPSDRGVQFQYVNLDIGWNKYVIPITHKGSEGVQEVVDRVVFHDGRLILETRDGNEEYLQREIGWTQTEEIRWEKDPSDARIDDPDVVLWERE